MKRITVVFARRSGLQKIGLKAAFPGWLLQKGKDRMMWMTGWNLRTYLEKEENSRQLLINSIIEKIGLRHPICYDVYNLCEYCKGSNLSKFNVVMFSLFAGLAGDVVEVVVKIGETSSLDFIVKVFKFPSFNINPFFAQGLTKHTYYICYLGLRSEGAALEAVIGEGFMLILLLII